MTIHQARATMRKTKHTYTHTHMHTKASSIAVTRTGERDVYASTQKDRATCVFVEEDKGCTYMEWTAQVLSASCA